jgi:hypothetical protein
MRFVTVLLVLLCGCAWLHEARSRYEQCRANGQPGSCAEARVARERRRQEESRLAASRKQREREERWGQDPRVRSAITRLGPAVVSLTCGGRTSAPSSELAEIWGVSFERPCGALVLAPDHAKTFATCADDACAERLTLQFLARLRERYPRADVAWTANHCVGYPDECSPSWRLEALYAQKHNDVASADFAEALMSAQQAVLSDEQARRAATRAAIKRAFQGVAAGFDQMASSVTCRTYDMDGVLQTSCR